MKFKSFLQNEIKGIFGKISSMNPGTAGYNIERNALKSNACKTRNTGKTTVGRMQQSDNIVTSVPKPSMGLPQQISLSRLSNRKIF